MNFDPQSTVSFGFSWHNYFADSADDANYSAGPLTASGAGVAQATDFFYSGGWASNAFSISPARQHFYLSAFAPTINGNVQDCVYPYCTRSGDAFSYVGYRLDDYGQNLSSSPIKVNISYGLHVATTSGYNSVTWDVLPAVINSSGQRSELTWIGGAFGTPNPYDPLVPYQKSDVLQDSLSFTLSPGSTLAIHLDLYARVGSVASTQFSWPIAEGGNSVLDASHTGSLLIHELDERGNPIAGNPHLAFLSGVDYSRTIDPVPEPATSLMLLAALPIVWALARRSCSDRGRRSTPIPM